MVKSFVKFSLIILLLAGCSEASGPNGRRAEQGTLDREGGAIPVEIMEVQEQDVVEWIRGIGSVSADKRVTLAVEVGARVAETLADVGAKVRELLGD